MKDYQSKNECIRIESFTVLVFNILFFVLFVNSVISSRCQNSIVSEYFVMIIASMILALSIYLVIKKALYVMKQVSIVTGVLLVYWTSVIASELYTINEKRLLIYYVEIVLCISFVIMLVYMLRNVKIEELINYMKNNYIIMYPILVVIIFTLGFIDTMPLWDSQIYHIGLYWNSQHFNPSITDFSLYSLAGHCSFGSFFFYSIGIFLFNGSVVGPRIINMILLSVAIYCFYKLIIYFCEGCKKEYAMLATLPFAFSPYTLGMICNIDIDYLSICFLTIFLYEFVYKRKVLCFISGMCLVFSKEPMMLAYMAFVGGYYLLETIKTHHKSWKISLLYFLNNVLSYSLPVVIWILYLLFKEGSYWGSDSPSSVNTFTFSLDNFINKVIQIMVANFSWCISLIILATIVMIIKNKKNRQQSVEMMFPFACVQLVLFLFNIVYFTIQHARYIGVFCVVSYLLAFSLLYKVEIKELYKKTSLILLTILMFGQSFFSIDLLTKNIYPTLEVGNSSVVSWIAPKFLPDIQFQFHDSIINNRQNVYWSLLIQEMVEETNITSNSLVVIPSNATAYQVFGQVGEKMYFDNETYEYTLNTQDAICMNVINEESMQQTKLDNSYDKIVYFVPVWLRDQFENSVLQQYSSVDMIKYDVMGWQAEVYVCK